MATIKDIAKAANVSMTAVSRVLNKDDSMSVGEDVRNRIFTIAHEMGYLPPKLRKLKVEDGITVGIADWHIIRRDRTNLKLSDFANIAKRFSPVPVTFKRLFFGEDAKVDGIIALGSFSEEETAYLKRQSFCILFVSSNKTDYQYDRIIIDHEVGLRQMLDYCLQTMQYPTVGFISGYYENENIVIGKTRNATFERLFRERDCYSGDRCLVGDMTAEGGYRLALQMIESKALPRALLTGSDELAEGVLAALQERGFKTPQDVDVIIYKDIETLLSGYPSSHPSVQMYTQFMWETAINMILQRIGGKRSEVMTLIFPSKLVCAK